MEEEEKYVLENIREKKVRTRKVLEKKCTPRILLGKKMYALNRPPPSNKKLNGPCLVSLDSAHIYKRVRVFCEVHVILEVKAASHEIINVGRRGDIPHS